MYQPETMLVILQKWKTKDTTHYERDRTKHQALKLEVIRHLDRLPCQPSIVIKKQKFQLKTYKLFLMFLSPLCILLVKIIYEDCPFSTTCFYFPLQLLIFS